ncbi:MAG: hypothetical protein HQK49_02080 [Oligoflexia bacterium]|nr:hypothetical protein [Oligoflexia bacterium]
MRQQNHPNQQDHQSQQIQQNQQNQQIQHNQQPVLDGDCLNTAWVENLALEELNMEESGIINFNEHLDTLPLIEESSIDFMNLIRERFEFYLNKFNIFRGNREPSAIIKIFKISNTVNDFMLFRNSLKLVVARKAANIISVSLISNTGGIYSARLNADTPAVNMSHEIIAHIGPFNNISWRFQEEVVDPEHLVRHYLSEFVKLSAK